MKKIFFVVILISFSFKTNAQKVYKEILRTSTEVAEDQTKDLATRKVYQFKVDALNYMLIKAKEIIPDSSMRTLDIQALAMKEFISMYIKSLRYTKGKKNKKEIKNRFIEASLNNPRYHDIDKELVLSYFRNKKYITQFSLDTDWVKALKEMRHYLR